MEYFRYTALRESNPDIENILPRPIRRKLIDDPTSEFNDEDAANSVKQLFTYLWDNKDVFNAFSNNFLVPYCE